MTELRTRSLATFLEEGDGRRPDVVGPVIVHGINFIGGHPGHGKTLLACELGVTKACGISRLGWVAEPGRVLVVSADMGPDALRDYFGPLMYPGRELALENINIATPLGLMLDEPDGAEALLAAIRDTGPALLILDYFANFISTDGYGNRELRPILDVLLEIRDVMGIAIVVIDQTRKSSGEPKMDAPPIDNLFGGRAKGAIADRVLFIKKDAGSGVFTVKGAKARGAGFADINLTFNEVAGWQRQQVSPRHSTPSETTVMACIASASSLRARTLKEIVSLTGLSKRTVLSALNALKFHGNVVEGPKVGREKTYKCASVQEGATQSAMDGAMKGASVQPPYKGADTPAWLHDSDGTDGDSSAMEFRFGAGAADSPAPSAYATVTPVAADGGGE